MRKKHRSIIAFKKDLKSTQKRWSALSDRVFLRTPDRCTQNVLNDPMRILKMAYRYLPNLAVMGIGAYYSPSFGVGCLAGIADYCLVSAIHNRVAKSVRRITKFFQKTLKTLNLSKEKPSISKEKPSKYSEYSKFLEKEGPFSIGVIGPIAEEFMFRGVCQSLLLDLTPTAVLFGFFHAFNPHKDAYTQAALCTLGGFIYGHLKDAYGLAAPIGAHILNNSWCRFKSDLFSLKK